MALLGVNIDHVATLRQARGDGYPDPILAALIAQKSGADSIVAHLREDRRHIQDQDILNLKKKLTIRLNLEMSIHPSVVDLALNVKPDQVTLVPERREEKTTESGLNVVEYFDRLKPILEDLKSKNITTSLFVDASDEQILCCSRLGVDAIEIHTGDYANAEEEKKASELLRIQKSIAQALHLGLQVNVGHGLNVSNIVPLTQMSGINEFNIGFSIIARAIEIGLESAIKEFVKLIR